ncbi:hypothetical protein [Nannocystis pusilla]|uniref:Right handed beta helix domain-containing protein n=1 Tax=Nannocystis pusilla TaxID=889268 RepID=A0ABS7U6X1_9BACT|nr:hypothetical protein [Nannocystis pusilla]MBZ5716057.1 hypothetical protein [Nannocystis pusilla]
MRSPRAWSYVTYLASALALLGACPPSTATTTDGDPTTDAQTQSTETAGDCPIGDLGCPCTQGGGCNPGLMCSPDQTCIGDDPTTTDGPTSLTSTSSTGGESSTTIEETSTTAPPVPCDPADGNPNPDCMAIDADQPYCSDSLVCGGCTVLPPDGCAIIDPSTPLCNPEDGKCVECTLDDASLCGGATPACNPATNACEGCFEHSHCPETACDILKRECFPSDRIMYIRHGSSQAMPPHCTDTVPLGGTEEAPYCNANLAIAHAQSEGPSSGWTFKFLEAAIFNSFHGSITAPSVQVDEPISYAFVHVGEYSQENASQHQHTQLQSSNPVINIGANITAYVDNFAVYSVAQSDNGVGVLCQSNSTVFLDDSFIRGTRGAGIRSFGCDLYLRRSSVYSSKTEGVELNCAEQHCELHMVNSYLTDNQHFQGDGGGGIVAENATLDINFSAILGNNAEVDANDPAARGDSIHCIGDNVGGMIRNSVIGRKPMGNMSSIKCDIQMLTVKTSLIDSDEFKDGNSKKAGETILQYFQDNLITGARPIDPDPGDTQEEKDQLDPSDLDLAMWEKGDPQVDFDGDPRQAKHMQPEPVGADVLAKP